MLRMVPSIVPLCEALDVTAAAAWRCLPPRALTRAAPDVAAGEANPAFSRALFGIRYVGIEVSPQFRSPSRAAAVAAGLGSVDGWIAWTVVESGRSLGSLREELMDKAAAASTGAPVAAEETDSDPQRRFEWLKEAYSSAVDGNPVEISVRGLLAMWNARSRDPQVSQRIEADLANHGLATSRNFRKVTIDSAVHLVTTTAEVEEAEASGVTPADADDAVVLDVGLTVGNLPSALGGVASVPPTATYEQAITVMLLNGYSQLAVLSGSRSLRGAVTWQSIARAPR